MTTVKKAALGVGLILACALLGWLVWEAPDSAAERVSGRDEPGESTAQSPLVADRPTLEGQAPLAPRVPLAPVVSLPAAWTIRGRVIDDQGVPVAGADLALRNVRLLQEHAAHTTDAFGRFQFDDVPPGTYTLQLWGNEFLSQVVHVIVGDIAGIEFIIPSGRSLEVLVEADDLPTSGLVVAVEGFDGSIRLGIPDAGGRAKFVLPEGPARAWLDRMPDGWLRGAERRDVPIAAEQTTVRLPLARAAWITGFVRRSDGRPVRGAVLSFRPSTERWQSVSDLSGAFRLAVSPDAVGDLVCAEVGAFFGSMVNRLAWYGITRGVRAGAVDVVVEVNEIANDRTLRVLVRDPDGAPASRAWVGTWLSSSGGLRGTETDASGRATLTNLPARPLLMEVRVPPSPDAPWLPPTAVEMLPAGQEYVVDIRRGVRLSGRVTSPAGPVAGAIVSASYGEEPFTSETSDEAGRFGFVLDPAMPSRLTITARHRGARYREGRVELDRLPTAPIELRLDR
jgi:hypothetical protein